MDKTPSTRELEELSTLKSLFHLFGAFIFVFCLGATIHELGHAITITLLGCTATRIYVQPFTASCEKCFGGDPKVYGVYGALYGIMGPLSNVTCATIITLLLWRKRKPILLPLLMMGPISYLTEGVGIVIGIIELPSLSDWGQVIINGNVSPVIVAIIGVAFLAIGIILMLSLFPLLNIKPDDSFMRKLAIFSGLVVYGLLSLMYVSFFDPKRIINRTIVLISIIVLVLFIAAISSSSRYISPLLNYLSRIEKLKVNWSDVRVAFGLDFVFLVIIQLFF